MKGSQGSCRNLEAGADAMAECCFLARSQGVLSLLFYTVQDHLLRGGIIHSMLTPSTSLRNQENVPTDLPSGQSDG